MANPEVFSILKASNRDDWYRFVMGLDERRNKFDVLDLSRADFSGDNLEDFLFTHIDLDGTNLQGAKLNGAEFSTSRMIGVNLSDAHLVSTDFFQVDLTEAKFDAAELNSATFKECRFADTSFVRAGLYNVNFIGSVMAYQAFGADFRQGRVGGNVWANLDLRGCRNLESLEHLTPSALGVDTILRSKGQIPEIFLRACGLPDELIAYARSFSLSASSIQLYTCFISHSAKDREFCQKLFNDLQMAGVRCWFAPEDIRIGDRIRDQIETVILLHDKLLLVLSDDSVQSDWVRSEVEGAFERERAERKHVLFPIRLDDGASNAHCLGCGHSSSTSYRRLLGLAE